MSRYPITRLLLTLAVFLSGTAFAAEGPAPLAPLPAFAVEAPGQPSITSDAVPQRPFSVIGPRGTILGQQDGSFEAWIFPWKILSHMRIAAEMQDYPEPIDVNQQAAAIDVEPGHTTITFSHANFTVRETLFAPSAAPQGAGALAFYQVEAVRPMTLTFSFTPDLLRMWPAQSDDRPSPEWVKAGDSGYYILHPNLPEYAAAIAMPTAEPGILPPYQERPKEYPLQFVIHYDPAKDSQKLYPLLMTVGESAAEATNAALAGRLAALDASFRNLYRDTQQHFEKFAADHLSIETPDPILNRAFAWAEVSIDQLRIETTPAHDETALVAGFFSSGDSARPGFGWFFGRDALFSLYAVNSYGDFALARDELSFLFKRQSPEGKIMHEWSQTAGLVDWKGLPYAYASADATPLLLMACEDYLKVSGDLPFLKKNWPTLEQAWKFETSHDSDGDGIYDNTEGTGWVESWPPGMPHQEIYLATLDQQASTAMAKLARATGHNDLAQQAEERAAKLAATIAREYLLPGGGFYAFSRNADGSLDPSPTIFPAVASWDGTFTLPNAQPMFDRWAAAEFSTDWGTRDLSPTVSFFDPISYHQGTVWPLYTGWAALSEYRNGRSLSGYAHLMQNVDLTWAQDLGAVTELLSGQFFAPLGRSTSHQLWSSAMVISPVLRGLFGLEWEAARDTLTVTPNLPAPWDQATLRHVPLGEGSVDLEMRRAGAVLEVTPHGAPAGKVVLASRTAGSTWARGVLRIPLPAVEVGEEHHLPEAGSTTQQMKVIDQQATPHSLTLTLAAPAGSHQSLMLRENGSGIRVSAEGAQLGEGRNGSLRAVQVEFQGNEGYVQQKVIFRW